MEAHFRVIPDGRNRAVAGLEEGSLLAQEIYLHNQRCFSGIGVLEVPCRRKFMRTDIRRYSAFVRKKKNADVARCCK